MKKTNKKISRVKSIIKVKSGVVAGGINACF
jgi:hypothetical protein